MAEYISPMERIRLAKEAREAKANPIEESKPKKSKETKE